MVSCGRGVRTFNGQQTPRIYVLAGMLVWISACAAVDTFYAAPVARASLMSVIGMAYVSLAIKDLWRARGDGLAARWPIMVLLLMHAAAIPVRIPLVVSGAATSLRVDLLAFVSFESVFLSICGAYLFASLVQERIVTCYRQASLVDPLTGAASRRAFFEQGPRLIRRNASTHQPVALLLFDLDNFKSVNDRFDMAPATLCLRRFAGWWRESCDRTICLRVSGARNLPACCRTRRAREPVRWQNACAALLRPPPTSFLNSRSS